MNLLTTTVLLAAATMSSSTVIKSPESGAIPPNFELLILHNNDMHARFEQTSQLSGVCTTADREAGKCYGGFPRVATVVKEARRQAATGEGPPVLYLNAGDTYTGTAWFTIYKWKIAAEFINALRPDAVSLGNHEFDNGVNGLTPFIESLNCPVLTANIVLTDVPELAAEANLKKSMIIDVDGVKIGIVGYLTPDTKVLAVQNDVQYTEETEAIREEVKKLQAQNIHIIIALGHSGYVKDLEIAREVDGLDLVIGGHTNTFLWNGTTPDSEQIQGPYPTYVKQASGRSVPVVQAYAYTKYFGKLLMTFDTMGEAIKITGQPILLDSSIPQDADVLKIIERYRDDGLNVADEIVGNTSVILSGENCKYVECNLGNLITDAMVYRYATHYKGDHWTDAPIAIIQGGGIRASISYMHMPANITKGDLLIVMPFEGSLVTVAMNGSVLLQMLERSVLDLNHLQDHGEFLQFSGIHVVYDYKKPPNSRVVKAEARCGNCKIPQYSSINKTQTYKVILPSFVANGGDGYSMLVDLPQTTLNYSELHCTEYYIRHRSPVFPQVEGRLIILNEEALYHKDSSTAVSASLKLIISLISLGNHEFDDAVDGLVPFIRNLSSPVVAANLILDEVPELKEVKNLYDSVVLQKNGVKIGIIGYLTPETATLAPKNKVEYEEEIKAIEREAHKLKKHGVEILIALGHSGYVKDVAIANNVNDLDLVIGGHSNTFLWNGDLIEKPETREGPYPTIVTGPGGRKVLVVQAYAYTKYLGRLHLTFNNKGEVTEYDGLPLLLNNKVQEDSEVLDIVNKYREGVNKISSEVVGASNVSLNGQCRLRECNLGNFLTDALLNYTRTFYNEDYPDVNIAVCQSGRIRISIDFPEKPFNTTKGDWINVLPFTDTLTILTMNGSILKNALEHSVALWRPIDSVGQFLQFSGIKVVYDLLKPAGSRIVKAQAICSSCGKSQLSDIENEYTYKIIMPSFLAEGGDGFSIFVGLPQEPVSYNELTGVYEYLRKYGTISPEVEDRIILLHEKEAIRLFKKSYVKSGSLRPSNSPSIHSTLFGSYCAVLVICGLLLQLM